MIDLTDIQLADNSFETPNVEKMCEWVAEVFCLAKRRPQELTIRIVGDEEMTVLNRRYRGHDSPTNVLSFPLEEILNVDTDALGDVVICGPVVNREAVSQNKPVVSHWAHIIIHGVLHLLGYDHQSQSDALTMEALESSILREFGFADPYTTNN